MQLGVGDRECGHRGQTLVKREHRIVYDVSADPEAGKVKMSDISKVEDSRRERGNWSIGACRSRRYTDGMTDEVVNRARQYPMELIKGDVMKTVELILPGSPEHKHAAQHLFPSPDRRSVRCGRNRRQRSDFSGDYALTRSGNQNKAGVFQPATHSLQTPASGLKHSGRTRFRKARTAFQNTGTETGTAVWNTIKLFGYR